MSTPLHTIIKDYIASNGAICVSQFMDMALSHPDHGYYMSKDPFGVQGDFTTAPEISQMFGEMVGAWVADTWMRMGRPDTFVLLECGAGRGTLMADILRVTKAVEGFIEACRPMLLETSPLLREKQREKLSFHGRADNGADNRARDGKDNSGHDVAWIESISDCPEGIPLIILGNELLDALPIEQYVMDAGVWKKRVIILDDEGFVFEKSNEISDIGLDIKVKNNDIFEHSPAREGFMNAVVQKIKTARGAGLFIDYGHTKRGAGDTLQAVYKHKYCNIFAHIGQADITSHVDFETLGRVCTDDGASVYDIVTQGAFLKDLGIDHRADALYKSVKYPHTSKDHARIRADIATAFHSLTASDQMGQLFKVMGFGYGLDFTPAGF